MDKCEICCPVGGGEGISGNSVRKLDFDQSQVISLRYYETEGNNTDLKPRIKFICHNHFEIFEHKYAAQQKKCCDPRGIHKKAIRKEIREISLEMSKTSQYKLIPGKKLCAQCRLWSQKPKELNDQGDGDTER